jgi:hypothetical protein
LPEGSLLDKARLDKPSLQGKEWGMRFVLVLVKERADIPFCSSVKKKNL